jgi:hypothetical protein
MSTLRGDRLERFVTWFGLRRLHAVGISSLLSSTSMRANAPVVQCCPQTISGRA